MEEGHVVKPLVLGGVVRPRPGGVAWLPTDLSSIIVWARGDGISGLSDGDLIGTAPDEAGVAQDFSQSTEGNKPTYKENIVDSLSVIRGDGTDDFMISTLASGLDDFTLAFSFQALANNNYRSLFGFGTYDPGIALNDSDKISVYDGGYNDFTDLAISADTWYVVMVWRTGGKYYASLNNVNSSEEKTISFSTTSTSFAMHSIRGSAWSDGGAQTDIQEVVLCDAALGATDRTSLYNHMGPRVGL